MFVLVVAAIVGVSSERMFWYWSTNPLDHWVVAIVYAPAVAGVLWLLSRYQVTGLWGVMLVAPVLGLLVEGVITPVVYSGGPFVPFFPVWFAFWHGVLGIVVLVYLFRRWLVADHRRPLLAASVAMGAFWGTWAMTMTLPENVADPELVADNGGPLHVLGPNEFALYALAFSAILVAAHALLGFGLWMRSFEPHALTRWIWLLATGAAVTAWTFAIPWAAPMFVAYVGLQVWALRRHARSASGPTALEELDGRVRPVSLAPIGALPAVAAFTYTIWWNVGPPEDVIRYGFMYGTIFVQAAVGAVLMFVSIRRSGRPPSRAPSPPWPPPTVPAAPVCPPR